MAASPLRLYQSQMLAGSCLGMGTPSAVVSSERASRISYPLADQRIPCVTQKEGITVKTHRRLSPHSIATGICYRVNTIAVPSAPALK